MTESPIYQRKRVKENSKRLTISPFYILRVLPLTKKSLNKIQKENKNYRIENK